MKRLILSVIVGSNRRESINQKLAFALAKLGEHAFDSHFVRIDDLPIYNEDLEAHQPAAVQRFRSNVSASDAVLFVTPEHNRSIPAVLKSAIDWGSRPALQSVWKNKTVATTGASPGAAGTAVGQQHLRQILASLGSLVMGGEAYISFRSGLVSENGDVTNEGTRAFLQNFMDQFAVLAADLTAARGEKHQGTQRATGTGY